jgi:hypothetical protein
MCAEGIALKTGAYYFNKAARTCIELPIPFK